MIRTLRQAGVQPYIMDLAPLALCRTLDKPRAIIINSRLDHLDVVVMEDRLPQLIHRLSLSGGVASPAERVPAIAEEVDRTVAFYNSSHRENLLDSTVPMFVCGDLAQVPESWQSLAGKLGCPVSILPSPVESPDGFDPSDFMVNIGLALKKLRRERDDANFSVVNFNALPEVYLPKGVSVTRIVNRVGIILGICLLIGMGLMVRSKAEYTSTLRSQLSSVQSRTTTEINRMKTLQDQVKQVGTQLAPVAARAGVFDTMLTSLRVGRDQMSTELIDIVNLVPTELYLTDVDHAGNSIKVSGVAHTGDEVFGYAKDLRDKFGDAIISSVKERLNESGFVEAYEFELLLRW